MILHIQILRFFAAIAVVLHHALTPIERALASPDLPRLIQWLAGLGFAGVDLFFVISGAVMAKTTRNLSTGGGSSSHFILARLARIYCGWWPFFIIYLLSFKATGSLSPDKHLVASFFLWPQSLIHQLLPITWTLSFELYFYLVLGGLLVLKRHLQILALSSWAAGITAFTLYNWLTGLYLPERFADVGLVQDFYFSPLILEFVAGFLIFEYLHTRPPINWKVPALFAAILMSVAIWYQLYGSLASSGMAGFHHLPERVLLIGGASSALVACALALPPPTSRIWKGLARFGDSSYAIYLAHIAVIAGVCLILTRLGYIQFFSPVMLLTLIVLAVILYAWMHYRWIEHPLYRLVRDKLSSFTGASRATKTV